MEYVLDEKLHGHAMVFDGPEAVAEEAAESNSGPNAFVSPNEYSMWGGRNLSSWEEVIAETARPWEEGLTMAESISRSLIDSGELPQPKCVRRRPVWREDDGNEIDVDRWMSGSGEPYWRDAKRESGTGPKIVSLLTNLDAACSTQPKSIAWRGAAAVCIADVLENAGYLVDMHVWCLGAKVYPGRNHKQFTTMRVKPPGDALDIGAIMSSLSGWFLRTALFGSFACCPTAPLYLGSMNVKLGRWSKYMTLAGDQVINVPVVKSESGAASAAVTILENLTSEDGTNDQQW